jgi:hypothetical protein
MANVATFNNASIILPPTHALPLGGSDLTRVKKFPSLADIGLKN